MNQGPQDMYYQQQMPPGSAPPPSQYPPQPSLLQTSPAQYPPVYGTQYGYTGGLTSPPTGPPVSNSMAPGHALPLPSVAPQQSIMPPNAYAQHAFDTTGQVAPAGMKPRVTATLWEDEGSLCFQVEARGICVARREDNHMINGTKLLNVAGMTRGRRDGILKSEKVRHVVKIGPMHLKGVWIPFERALDFANKEKITELLYPLFVHNIGALLYHPTNQTRSQQVMRAAEQRKAEQNSMRNAQAAGPHGLPSLQQHHHHQMTLPAPPQQSLASQNGMGRPSMDRAHTFPTPPTSASSVMGPMGTSETYNWGQQGMGAAQGNGQISIDTNLSNARSMPTTPATTPPGTSLQSMQQYPPASQPYADARPLYNAAPPQQSPYSSNGMQQERSMYGQPGSYVKSEMGPPTGQPAGADPNESKPSNGLMHPGQNEGVPQSGAEEEPDHDHEAEYTHNSTAYDANRAPQYNYNAPPGSSMSNEHNLSPEMTGSPHQAGSGRATPRTAAAPQAYYASQGYSTPPRVQQSSSTLYNVMTNDRGAANGASGSNVYAPQADMGGSIHNGYPAQPPTMNGSSGGVKRGRDDEDDRPSSGGTGMIDMKRRKTLVGTPINNPAYATGLAQPASVVPASRQ